MMDSLVTGAISAEDLDASIGVAEVGGDEDVHRTTTVAGGMERELGRSSTILLTMIEDFGALHTAEILVRASPPSKRFYGFHRAGRLDLDNAAA